MIVIIDYGLRNLRSVANAFVVIGSNAIVSNRPDDLCRADRIVLPGVGAFGEGINNLRERG